MLANVGIEIDVVIGIRNCAHCSKGIGDGR